MSSVEQAREYACSYRIEPMSEHDLIEVVEIEETTGLSRWGWEAYHAELVRAESLLLVAQADVAHTCVWRVEGFIAARLGAGELHVNNIGVREWARRRGIASALLAKALAWAASAGARAAFLEVRAGNRAAQMLYRRHGFEAVGRRRNYYREPVEDALVMRAPLNPSA